MGVGVGEGVCVAKKAVAWQKIVRSCIVVELDGDLGIWSF